MLLFVDVLEGFLVGPGGVRATGLARDHLGVAVTLFDAYYVSIFPNFDFV